MEWCSWASLQIQFSPAFWCAFNMHNCFLVGLEPATTSHSVGIHNPFPCPYFLTQSSLRKLNKTESVAFPLFFCSQLSTPSCFFFNLQQNEQAPPPQFSFYALGIFVLKIEGKIVWEMWLSHAHGGREISHAQQVLPSNTPAVGGNKTFFFFLKQDFFFW